MASNELGSEGVQNLAAIIAGLAALNWGLIEFVSFDLLQDITPLAGTEYQLTVGVLAAAGALVAYNALQRMGD